MRQWSKSYNLVSSGDLDSLVSRHLLDALSVHKFLKGDKSLDVGSGAGFPGMALAIVNPAQQFWLLDSNGKKVRFLRHVARQLDLRQVHVIDQRAEHYSTDIKFSSITCRAFSSLSAFARAVRHLACPEARLLAMKGRLVDGELAGLPGWVRVTKTQRIKVPGLDAERHVVCMSLLAEPRHELDHGADQITPDNSEKLA